MQRFKTGEQVLISHFMGDPCDPPRCGVVRQVYPTSYSMLYDYLVRVDACEYSVRDEWLIPHTIVIFEDQDWSDLESQITTR